MAPDGYRTALLSDFRRMPEELLPHCPYLSSYHNNFIDRALVPNGNGGETALSHELAGLAHPVVSGEVIFSALTR